MEINSPLPRKMAGNNGAKLLHIKTHGSKSCGHEGNYKVHAHIKDAWPLL